MSKLFLPATLAVVCLWTVGCETVDSAQYRIASAAASAADRDHVREVLRTVAQRTGLQEQTSTSLVRNTLVYYAEPEDKVLNYKIGLGARLVGSDVIVDLGTGIGPQVDKFTQARALLAPALAQAFGSRVSEVPRGQSVALEQVPNPVPTGSK